MGYRYKYNLKLTKKANEVFGGIVKGAYVILNHCIVNDKEFMLEQEKQNTKHFKFIGNQKLKNEINLEKGDNIALHLFNDSIVEFSVSEW